LLKFSKFGKYYERLLFTDELSAAALLLLPALLPPPMVTTTSKNKKRWRPSLAESQAAFIDIQKVWRAFSINPLYDI